VDYETHRHQRDWHNFAKLLSWATASIAAILILLRILLV
jgi:hypothetical protein